MKIGHNFWLGCPMKLMSIQLSYILKAIFRDTPRAYNFFVPPATYVQLNMYMATWSAKTKFFYWFVGNFLRQKLADDCKKIFWLKQGRGLLTSFPFGSSKEGDVPLSGGDTSVQHPQLMPFPPPWIGQSMTHTTRKNWETTVLSLSITRIN